ncbi:MAG: Ig-like domain-containing protein [Anaerolineae bacterium]
MTSRYTPSHQVISALLLVVCLAACSGEPAPWSSPLPAPTTHFRSPLPRPQSHPLTSPKIVSIKPGLGARLDNLHTPLVITHERPVDPQTASLTIEPPTEGQTTWRDDRTLVFIPRPGWAPETSYTVHLGKTFFSSFSTPPLIRYQSPPLSSKGARCDTAISLHFGFPVDQASVQANFTITPTVNGTFRWEGDRLLTFEPAAPLEIETTYHVQVGPGLRDRSGTPVDGSARWWFTTGNGILSVYPSHGSHAPADANIRVQFGAPMERASVEAAFAITPTVAGSLRWENDSLLIFQPDDFFENGTSYHITLAASARTADGEAVLRRDYGWTFHARPVEGWVSFGYGPNVQVVDADGQRTVQLEAKVAQQIELRVYDLSLEQFLDRYCSAFRGIGPSEDRSVETADLPLITRWRQDPGRTEVALPADLPPGLYVLEARYGTISDQLIIVLSRNALVVKQSSVGRGAYAQHQVLVWGTRMANHSPVPGMQVRVYDRDGTLVAEGNTEERGLLRTTITVDPQPLIVVGRLGNELTVSGLSNEWEEGGWSWWWKSPPRSQTVRIYAYTDRPIYRPGQTVHVRAVLRRDDDAAYSLIPPDTEVTVRLRDARDNVLAVRNLTPDDFGAVYTDFELAEDGTVGTYHVEVAALGETSRQSLKVEAYRKPDYEVAVTPYDDQIIAGDPLTVTVAARYFFGEPVANARVTVLPYVAYGDPWWDGEHYTYPKNELRRIGRTDSNGLLTITLPTQPNDDRGTWSIEATVSDESGLAVSDHARVVIHPATFGLHLDIERYGYEPGEPIPVRLLARDYHGRPLAGAEVTVGVYGWNPATGTYDNPVARTRVTTGARGEAATTLHVTEQGWYQVRAEGSDEQERPVSAGTYLWVYDDSAPWYTGQSDELRISADRAEYRPGDVAQLVIVSPVSGPALLTFERGTTRREAVVHLEKGMTTLPAEILPDDVPNVHVAVAVWAEPVENEYWYRTRPEGRLLTARTQLLVPAEDRRLTVSITPDREKYAPRDEALFTVQVSDALGNPVQAQFSLALVDEAIFALAEDETPPIFDAFYAPRADLVRTFDSLQPTRYLGGGMGGGGGGGDLGSGGPRADFPDTAFWDPAIETDENGVAHVHVRLPDSLTSWRAVVRAVTADTRVGQQTARVTVAQPLLVRPLLPRFLVQGDRVTLRAIVHNYTDAGMTVTARVELTGLTLDDAEPTQEVYVEAGGTAVVGWPVIATRLGQAQVTVGVVGEAGRDAVALSLPILPLAMPDLYTASGPVETEVGEWVLAPSDLLTDVSDVEIRLAASIVSSLLDGLEYLIDYPFG